MLRQSHLPNLLLELGQEGRSWRDWVAPVWISSLAFHQRLSNDGSGIILCWPRFENPRGSIEGCCRRERSFAVPIAC